MTKRARRSKRGELLPTLTEEHFQTWRDQRDWIARKRAMWARGEKLPSERPSSLMRCSCGATFDSHRPAESQIHTLTSTLRKDTMEFDNEDERRPPLGSPGASGAPRRADRLIVVNAFKPKPSAPCEDQRSSGS
ncbi:hypothetical protein AB7M49_005936 [Bradyrhizobium elkanii]|uniref:hypothetical protein n=1 Tax=Bradyrhizobium TaxID=374 RepID=UPI0020A1A594|nr:hypothetical protein [Bradyrhizobium elkanii]MCP1968282.1 hypothetical protein [Bradyrhizobium elkanii]MCS4110217.1 hypothetical protein [Bradyrhizobium elkanii]